MINSSDLQLTLPAEIWSAAYVIYPRPSQTQRLPVQNSKKELNMPTRCEWAGSDPMYVAYHDEEWGVPVHDDLKLFEFLILEGMQAGLSWSTILRKRENFRQAFDHFDPKLIASYDQRKVKELMGNAGIIRNLRKIESAIGNAQAFLAIQEEFSSFDTYLWQFVGGKPKINAWRSMKEIPAQTVEAVTMSKDLVKRGFRFVGPTICYAHMQAIGMVNDHTVDCFRYTECQDSGNNR
jgi:DNA-3-methyladenine glycosylase I